MPYFGVACSESRQHKMKISYKLPFTNCIFFRIIEHSREKNAYINQKKVGVATLISNKVKQETLLRLSTFIYLTNKI